MGESEARERDQIRKDKLFERRKERNLQNAAPARRNKIMMNDEERDITEKIALGVASKWETRRSSTINVYSTNLQASTKDSTKKMTPIKSILNDGTRLEKVK